jgi:proline iminopeptidase
VRTHADRQPSIEEGHLDVGDARLFVRRVGGRPGGPVLLAVHGGPGISHEPLQLIEPLADARVAVVTYDQRGVGRSTGRVDETAVFAQAVADLAAVARSSGAARVHLLGHSWGGLLAALYAAARPPQLASLVLVDSVPATSAQLGEAMGRFRERLRAFQARGLIPAELPGLEDDGGAAHLLALWPLYFCDPRHPAARSLAGASISAAAHRAGAAALDRYDLRAALAAVTVPALHVLTPVPFGVQMGAAMADALPAAPGRRLVLDDAGHLPWIEQPARFLPAVSAFIRSDDTTHQGERP